MVEPIVQMPPNGRSHKEDRDADFSCVIKEKCRVVKEYNRSRVCLLLARSLIVKDPSLDLSFTLSAKHNIVFVGVFFVCYGCVCVCV